MFAGWEKNALRSFGVRLQVLAIAQKDFQSAVKKALHHFWRHIRAIALVGAYMHVDVADRLHQ